jgi:hypothetical protein
LWDLVLSEWIPEEYGKHLPRAYQVVAMTAGLASWQVWLLIGAAIVVFAAIEYAYRRTNAAKSPALPQAESTEESVRPSDVEESRTLLESRTFVPPELTPQRLFSFYRQNTAIQGAERIKSHVGQWMRVTGTIGEILPFNGYFSQVTFKRSFLSNFGDPVIFMYFCDAQIIDRLKILERGDKITVVGQLKDVDLLSVHLENCELA